MQNVIAFLMPFLYFLFFNATMVLITKKEFGKCLPLSFMISTFFLFISQVLFHTFQVGFVVSIIFALMSIPIILYLKIKNKKEILQQFKENYFDVGIVAFAFIYFIFTIFDLFRILTKWDEFMHWGVMVKEMIRTDAFYSEIGSTLMMHKDYPPIISIYEMLWVKLSGVFTDAVLLKSLHIFEFCLFIPILYKKQKNGELKLSRILEILIIIPIVYLLMLMFDLHDIINTIYVDYFMGILLAYSMFLIISEKNKLSYFSLVNIGTTLTFLVLTKQMGLPFYLIAIFAFAVCVLVDKYKQFKKEYIIRIVMAVILLLIIPLTTWKLWGNYVEGLGVSQQFKISDMKISELPNIISGQSENEHHNTVARNFISGLSKNYVTMANINFSFTQAIAICLMLFVIVLLVYGKNKYSKGQKISIFLSVIIGIIGYTFTMLNIYIFSLNDYEGSVLASFDRYMGTYIIFMLSLIGMLYFNNMEEGFWKKASIILLTLIIVQHPYKIPKLIPAVTLQRPFYLIEAERVGAALDEKTNLYIVDEQKDGDYGKYIIKYYNNSKIMDTFHNGMDEISKMNPQDYENFLKHISKRYKYLYVKSVDENFIDNYLHLFKDGEIKKYSIYEIKNTDDEIQFEFIKQL